MHARIAVVAGIDGFLGRHLARQLLRTGHQVIGLSRRSDGWTDPGLSRVPTVLTIPDNARVGVEQAMNRLKASERHVTVYHLAGIADAHVCESQPFEAFCSNVVVTASLLEVARHLRLPRIVFASTGLVYAVEHRRPIEESQLTRPDSVYAATKLAAEAMIEGYASRHAIAAAVLRIGNVYGAGMTESSVVGKLLLQASRREALVIKSGAPTRDFLYVGDAVEGMIAVARVLGGARFEVYNLSSGVGCTVGDLARTLARVVDPQPELVETAPHAVGSHPWLVLSNARLRSATGWQPRRSLAEGLADSLRDLSAQAS